RLVQHGTHLTTEEDQRHYRQDRDQGEKGKRPQATDGGAAGLLDGAAIPLGPGFVAGGEGADAFDPSHEGWDAGPTEDEVDHAQDGLAEIELVDPEPTQQQSEKGCDRSAL